MNLGVPASDNLELHEHMKMLANGITLFLERGDEISIQIFKECIREAFRDSKVFQ